MPLFCQAFCFLDFLIKSKPTFKLLKVIASFYSSNGRSSLNVGGDVVEPASSLVIQDQQSMISFEDTI